MKARDLMTSGMRVVTAQQPVSRAAEIMRDFDVGMVPVVDDPARMHLRGVITDLDVAVRCVAAGHSPTSAVGDYMTPRPLETVSPAAHVHEVMELMKEFRVRRVLVVEGDRLVGVISQADLARREGPVEPLEMEKVLERISEPSQPAVHR